MLLFFLLTSFLILLLVIVGYYISHSSDVRGSYMKNGDWIIVTEEEMIATLAGKKLHKIYLKEEVFVTADIYIAESDGETITFRPVILYVGQTTTHNVPGTTLIRKVTRLPDSSGNKRYYARTMESGTKGDDKYKCTYACLIL